MACRVTNITSDVDLFCLKPHCVSSLRSSETSLINILSRIFASSFPATDRSQIPCYFRTMFHIPYLCRPIIQWTLSSPWVELQLPRQPKKGCEVSLWDPHFRTWTGRQDVHSPPGTCGPSTSGRILRDRWMMADIPLSVWWASVLIIDNKESGVSPSFRMCE